MVYQSQTAGVMRSVMYLGTAVVIGNISATFHQVAGLLKARTHRAHKKVLIQLSVQLDVGLQEPVLVVVVVGLVLSVGVIIFVPK